MVASRDLWPTSRAQGLQSALELTSLGLTIPLTEVYEGWTFNDQP
jgi:hypothetical protein